MNVVKGQLSAGRTSALQGLQKSRSRSLFINRPTHLEVNVLLRRLSAGGGIAARG
jgi:hypothetical protein